MSFDCHRKRMKSWVGTNNLVCCSHYNAPTVSEIEKYHVGSVTLFTLPTIFHGQPFNNITWQPLPPSKWVPPSANMERDEQLCEFELWPSPVHSKRWNKTRFECVNLSYFEQTCWQHVALILFSNIFEKQTRVKSLFVTDHTCICRVCWRIIVHWYRCGCRPSLSHQWSTMGNLWLKSQWPSIYQWSFVLF